VAYAVVGDVTGDAVQVPIQLGDRGNRFLLGTEVQDRVGDDPEDELAGNPPRLPASHHVLLSRSYPACVAASHIGYTATSPRACSKKSPTAGTFVCGFI
jgi:hypothetical protein